MLQTACHRCGERLHTAQHLQEGSCCLLLLLPCLCCCHSLQESLQDSLQGQTAPRLCYAADLAAAAAAACCQQLTLLLLLLLLLLQMLSVHLNPPQQFEIP